MPNFLTATNAAASMGYRMPPEWVPQEAIWLSWPVADPRHWGGQKFPRIASVFATIAATISRYEIVRLNVQPNQSARVESLCREAGAEMSRIELYEHPHNDVWCRDHGPIFLQHRETGQLAISDWEFNAWGEKFPPWEDDNAIPSRIAKALDLPIFSGGMILEGGAIEVNGAGQLLTTEAVLLNPNRNPQLTRQQIETALIDTLGVQEILWLARGIEGDDTDGHIDDLARFVRDDAIVACVEPDASSPNASVLRKNLERLRSFRTADGGQFDVIELPMPARAERSNWRLPVLPASYANFLILNQAVLVPTFGQPKRDQRALDILRECFPEREICGLDCTLLVEEGGGLHCISQQQPAV